MYRRIAIIESHKLIFVQVNLEKYDLTDYQKDEIDQYHTIYYNATKVIAVRFDIDGKHADTEFNIRDILQAFWFKKRSNEDRYFNLKRSLENVI